MTGSPGKSASRQFGYPLRYTRSPLSPVLIATQRDGPDPAIRRTRSRSGTNRIVSSHDRIPDSLRRSDDPAGAALPGTYRPRLPIDSSSSKARAATTAVQTAALASSMLWQRHLQRAGVNVHIFDDTPEPHTPDSIFPNNWVSFHADGTVVLYPMLAPESPAGAPARSARSAARAIRLSHRAHRRSHASRSGGQVSRRHRQPGARSQQSHRLRVPLAAHRSGCARRFRAAARLRHRRVRSLRCAAARRSITRTC